MGKNTKKEREGTEDRKVDTIKMIDIALMIRKNHTVQEN
jgi:hypothetical protein